MQEDHESFPAATNPTNSRKEWREIYANPDNAPHFNVPGKHVLAGLCENLMQTLGKNGIWLPQDIVEIGAGTHPFAPNIARALPRSEPPKEATEPTMMGWVRGKLTATKKPNKIMYLTDPPAYEFDHRKEEASIHLTHPAHMGASNGYEVRFSRDNQVPADIKQYHLIAISAFNYADPLELLGDSRIRTVTLLNSPGLGSTQAKDFSPKSHEEIVEMLQDLGFVMIGEVVTENRDPQNEEFAQPISGGMWIKPENSEEKAKLQALFPQPARRYLDTAKIPDMQYKGSLLNQYGLTGDDTILAHK